MKFVEEWKCAEKEISIAALMTVSEMLGWREKTVLFSGDSLSDFLKTFSTKNGENLYDVLVGDDGIVRLDYTVRLNNRPLKQAQSLEIGLEPGDRVVLLPIMKFAAGG